MAAQYYKKNLTKIFGVFERLLTYNSTQLKINNYLDSARTYGKLLEKLLEEKTEQFKIIKRSIRAAQKC